MNGVVKLSNLQFNHHQAEGAQATNTIIKNKGRIVFLFMRHNENEFFFFYYPVVCKSIRFSGYRMIILLQIYTASIKVVNVHYNTRNT